MCVSSKIWFVLQPCSVFVLQGYKNLDFRGDFANCENGKAAGGQLPHFAPGTFCVSTQVLHEPTLPRRQTMHDSPGQGPQGGDRRRVPQRRQPWH